MDSAIDGKQLPRLGSCFYGLGVFIASSGFWVWVSIGHFLVLLNSDWVLVIFCDVITVL